MLYFAYGSNMDQEQMRQRCPTATVEAVGTLPGHRFVINVRGVATIAPGESARVVGVPWKLSIELAQ